MAKLVKKKPSKATKAVEEKTNEVNTHVVKEKYDPDVRAKVPVMEKGAEQSEDNTQSSSVIGLPVGKTSVGISKGYTVNLGNYESDRISCWMTKICDDNEIAIMDTLGEISQLIDEQIEFETAELKED